MDILDQFQTRATTVMKGLEHLIYRHRQLVQPEEEKAQGDLINVYKYLMEGHNEDGARLFSVMLSRGTRDSKN